MKAASARLIKVEVAYSPAPREVDLRELHLPEGASVAEAIAASGLYERHAELTAGLTASGIWGRTCRTDRALVEGDRVEVYRPLRIDPKEARRQRGREQKPLPKPVQKSVHKPKQAQRTGRTARLSGTGSA